MPKITEELFCNGAEERIRRLGMMRLLEDIRVIVTGFRLRVKEEKDANGGAAVRKLIDARFERTPGWIKRQTGGVDWTKCEVINGTRVCIGVEVQFSARSDLLAIDIHHLRKVIVDGSIDVGVLVVPNDRLGAFLTDRGPKMSDARRHVEEARAQDLPLVLIAVQHDGPGPPLAKQAKKPSGHRE
jgi:hypothetical protein